MGPAAWRDYSGDPKVFYRKGVGPLTDIGVYMLHTITGLFGPATRVEAVGGIVYPERTILIDRMFGEKITVEAPDVLSINLEFGNGRFAHLFTSYATAGFQVSDVRALRNAGLGQCRCPASGTTATAARTSTSATKARTGEREAWQDDVPTPDPLAIGGILESGILHAVDSLENGTPNALTPEHATHVLEIMLALSPAPNPVTR